MIDERDLEQAEGVFAPPEGSFDRFLRYRNGKRRNQRIAASVVGIAVFVAAIWVVTTGGPFDRSGTSVVPGMSGMTGPAETGPGPNGPYTQPTYELGRVTPEDIALGESFLDAWANGDGEAVAAMFAPDGNFDGFQPAILPALHEWFRAGGWTFRAGGCGLHGWGPARGVVGCGLTFENDLTRAVGMAPVETHLSFVTDAGAIQTAWYGGGGDVGPHLFGSSNFRIVWYTFVEWIASRRPEDYARMYDADHGYPILDAASIELWRRSTGEFVASPEAQELARSLPAWDGVGIPPEGMTPSTPVEGELIAGYDADLGPHFAFVYADGRVVWGSSPVEVGQERRLTPEGVELVRSGAVEAERFALSGSPVPAGAWQDAEARPYVPSRYAVCFYLESGDSNPGNVNDGYEYPPTVLRFLPARAREILTGREHTYGGHPAECSEVTTDEARELWAIFYGSMVEDAEGDLIHVEMNWLLPHGEWVAFGG